MNEWISIKERFPPEKVKVLVSDREKFMEVAELLFIDKKPFKWTRCGPGMTFDSITHWMPLPKPPILPDL